MGYPTYLSEQYTTLHIPEQIDGRSRRRRRTEYTTLHIPEQIDGKPVVAFLPGAFDDLLSLEEFDVDSAYFKTVDGVLFSADGKTLLAYPREKEATEYVVPNGVETVAAKAFKRRRQLTQVTLPAGLQSIGEQAFEFCELLTALNVAPGNACFKSVDGVLFSADGKTLLAYPIGKEATEYVVPNGVETVGVGAFDCCQALEEIVFPESLRCVGDNAFEDCASLRNIRFSDGLLTLGNSAFMCCVALTEVSFPESLRSVGGLAFAACDSLTKIATPPDLKAEPTFAALRARVRRNRWKRLFASRACRAIGASLIIGLAVVVGCAIWRRM